MYAAKIAVSMVSIVELLNAIGDVGLSDITGVYIRFLIRSFVKMPKNDSAIALSRQFPRRLTPGSR